ncbi:MAG: biotin transporter BioY [Roseburia sp.]|nr:biotin transporter BioY [Roseburia sp.]
MRTRRLVSIAVFTALMIVGGWISVPVPFTPTKLSFQTLFAVTAGLLLGGRDGALAVLVYIAMGLIGLPVFTNGGGVGYVFMPSFGYLIGFVFGALLCGAVCSHLKHRTRGHVFLAALVGLVPVYAVGMTYQVLILYYYVGSAWAAALGGLPSIVVLAVKDAALCGLVASLYPSLSRAVGYRRGAATKSSRADVNADPQYR